MANNNTNVYLKQGGNEQVIASGGIVTVESGGTMDLESGAALTVESGGAIDVESGGSVTLESGGTLTVESGGSIAVESGGTIALQPGAVMGPQLTSPIQAVIVVGTEVPNVINVTIQLKDAEGSDLTSAAAIPWYLADDAAGLNPATVAHSVGASIGVDGALIEWIANLSGLMISEADGDIDIDFEEAGTLTKYLVLVNPWGELLISAAITH